MKRQYLMSFAIGVHTVIPIHLNTSCAAWVDRCYLRWPSPYILPSTLRARRNAIDFREQSRVVADKLEKAFFVSIWGKRPERKRHKGPPAPASLRGDLAVRGVRERVEE